MLLFSPWDGWLDMKTNASMAEKAQRGNQSQPAFAGHPETFAGLTGSLPQAADMRMGARSWDTETPRLPRPPLYPSAMPWSRLG